MSRKSGLTLKWPALNLSGMAGRPKREWPDTRFLEPEWKRSFPSALACDSTSSMSIHKCSINRQSSRAVAGSTWKERVSRFANGALRFRKEQLLGQFPFGAARALEDFQLVQIREIRVFPFAYSAYFAVKILRSPLFKIRARPWLLRSFFVQHPHPNLLHLPHFGFCFLLFSISPPATCIHFPFFVSQNHFRPGFIYRG